MIIEQQRYASADHFSHDIPIVGHLCSQALFLDVYKQIQLKLKVCITWKFCTLTVSLQHSVCYRV